MDAGYEGSEEAKRGSSTAKRNGMKAVRDKTVSIWDGPAVVLSEENPRVFVVRDLGNDREATVHAEYLKRYANKDLTVTTQLKQYAAHGGRGYEVLNIRDHRKAPDKGKRWEFLIHWGGYTVDECTWEPVYKIHADVPILTRQYIKLIQDERERKQLLDELEKHKKG